jgi:NAD(P)-dependent dehydrogenase (short-subunit alcohol dehydrogenase family)
MDLKLHEKTVFISGSTSGIGFGVASQFLQEGASVYINGRTEESVKSATIRLKSLFPNGKMEGIAADFSKADAIKILLEKLPEIDILINNVGIYTSKPFLETTDEDWHRHIEVNVMSGVRLARHFLPQMLKNNWGRIIFVSSECATLVPADLIAYSTTKTSLLALSRGLAQLTKGTQVTVNAVLPGSTMTEGAQQFLSQLAIKEDKTMVQAEIDFFREARPNSILQRFASIEEIANTIVYYSSPLAAATNGASIKLDGGSTGGII